MKQPAITLDAVISQNPELVTSNIDDEVVMMSITKGEYYGIDPIGSRIWQLAATPLMVADLINLLLEEFEVDRQTCEQDVIVFLAELAKDDIITIAN